MGLFSYCIIHTIVMTINCAEMANIESGGNNDDNTNRKRALQGCEHSLCILEGSTCLREKYIDEFDLQYCEMNQNKRIRTDSGLWTYPYPTETLSEQVMVNNNRNLTTSAIDVPYQPTEIIYGSIPETSSGCVASFPCNPAISYTNLQTQWNYSTFDYRQGDICDTDNRFTSHQTNYACKYTNQRDTNPNLLSKDELNAASLAYSNQLQQTAKSKYSAKEITELLNLTKWHSVSGDQSRFLDLLKTATSNFDELHRKYQLEIDCFKQSNSLYEFFFRIISRDLVQFQIFQVIEFVVYHDQNFSQSYVYLPSFENYYERCKKSLSNKTKTNIIFSQEWSALVQRQANFMLYTDFSESIAGLVSCLSKDQYAETMKKFSRLYHLDIVFVPSTADDAINNQFDPNDYFICSVVTHEEANSYIPIDTEKYTLYNAIDHFAEFAIFKQFVFDTFFIEHPSQIFHTIKEELWKLQMFMSEIYLYLTWRLTMTENISVYEGDIKYGLKEEINDLADIVDAFYRHNHPTALSCETFETLKLSIDNFRLDILAMLKCHFGNSAMYHFYRIAHVSPLRSRYKDVYMRNRDILSMLAFAPKSQALEILSENIKQWDVKLKINVCKSRLGKLTQNYLGKILLHKVEMIEIIIALVKFIRELKPSFTLKNEEKNLIIAHNGTATLVSPGAYTQSLKVKILSNCEFYVYFHGLLYDLFAY